MRKYNKIFAPNVGRTALGRSALEYNGQQDYRKDRQEHKLHTNSTKTSINKK